MTDVVVELQTATPMSAAATQEAEALRESVIAAISGSGLDDPGVAQGAGYVPMFGDPLHWYNPKYLTDGKVFDPGSPEFLVVDGDQVVGVMFLADSPGTGIADPPGAPLVKWHYHEWSSELCLEDALVPVALPQAGECPPGTTAARESPAMAHVWLVDIEDPFAADMHAHEGH